MMDRKRITVKNASRVDGDEVLHREANILGRYLIKRAPHEAAVSLYIEALGVKPCAMSEREHKRLAFVRRHPWALGLVDAGLAVVDSTSEVRRRIYIMFSILESMPHHHDQFLPVRRKWWFLFAVGLTSVIGVGKTIIGSMLVKAITE
jgi:hypothetical protein